ncbi:acetyl-coenzyme A transporter 1-domain-containing protein [Dichotomopilus funicola]|uniref:Acetyl-coenzyme A transporter 1-domain-containing protein n=1 Tax=Dichotomopilus funicola TaxID=1934379 RepID=A0AAN6V5M1_9PEZI|nr:acetyl-coenzyme A transporter 1-domain-containing protein [Dichotomopilus funicola]
MGTKSRRSKSPPPTTTPNGSIGRASGRKTNGDLPKMNTGNVELQRRNISQETSTPAAAAANRMARESFTLDEDPVPKTPTYNNHGFFDLPKRDQRNFGLLVLLYFLQGIPLGLATGSVPFLLKNHMSYGEIGIFSLASYPYSLKLFWSPIVDAVWSPKVGRRKSWILPIQFLSGIGMLYLGSVVEGMMEMTGKPGGPTVWGFTGWWFFLVLMCATQDIAVDGWALTLLTPSNVSYASTAQTVGLTAGHFLSYTVFLAFYSKDFANRWFRTVPLDHGLVSLGGYLTFAGWAYILVTAGLAFLKREEKTKNEDGIWDVYKIMWGVLKLKNIQTIIIVHLIAKIGFQANDSVTSLKLLDKGFGTENMALTVLIDFPFEIGLGYYAGKWSQEYTPMRLWCWGFAGRLASALVAQFTVSLFPSTGGVTPTYLLAVIAQHVFSTFTNTIMFVAVSAFHARIADPVIGGTYMTLLATVCNLGGTFPRFFVLRMVDAFTSATCISPSTPPSEKLSPLADLSALVGTSCAIQADKERCLAAGGLCEMQRDGYYLVNILCVLIGVVTFVLFIRPKVLQLQSLPLRAWRLGSSSSSASPSRSKY